VGATPVDDVNVRKALLHAIDYATMVKVASDGSGIPWTNGGLAKVLPCNNPASASYFEFNVQMAKDLLKASKYGGPEKLPKIRMTPNTTNAQVTKMFQIIQEMWRTNLGITDVEIKAQPSGYGDEEKLLAVDRQSAGAQPPDAALMAKNFWHSSSLAATRFMGGYKNEQVDKLVDEAYSLARTDAKYCAGIQAAEKLFLEDAMFIPLAQSDRPISGVAQPWLADVAWSPKMTPYSVWTKPLSYIRKH
jgi:peptide/nickel transport system substrate-binding protein